MTAHARIAQAIHDDWCAETAFCPGPDGNDASAAGRVIEAIRGMTHDELRELRPDIAIIFDCARDTAATRSAYIVVTAHATSTDGRPVTIYVTTDDEGVGS